jgi:PBP1b-binding outer membrane lipoprotein LpoB
MERRILIKRIFSALLIGGILVFAGCAKKEKPAGFGNQEKLWKLTTAESKIAEPIDLAYVKDTPALYRDASMGKADPSFVPKVSGG